MSFNPLSALQRYLAIGAIVLVAVALAWGARVDHLRGYYKAAGERVAVALVDAGFTDVTLDNSAAAVAALDAKRRQYLAERNDARGQVVTQSQAVDAWKAEGDRLTAVAAANRKLAESVTEQRDVWIKRAREAETRTERRAAELELEECNGVLDALYRDGF